MFRNKEDLHSSVKEKPQTLSYLIMKWWKSLNRNLAHRLLYMAQHGSKKEREKAVHSLSSLKHLKGNPYFFFIKKIFLRKHTIKNIIFLLDWHYRDVAQMLDARTAVALARTKNSDLRFFLKPPYYHEQYKLYV